MVNGLPRFREHFREFGDRFVLIGGAACDLIHSDLGLAFRATKDLDIVLLIETIDASFARRFWTFVLDATLELFARAPGFLEPIAAGNLTPIPVDEGVSSLSAIVLDDECFQLIRSGRVWVDGIPIVDATHLIPLKARAWINLSAQRTGPHPPHANDVSKHRNDVLRLHAVVPPETHITPSAGVWGYMGEFITRLAADRVDPRELDLQSPIETVIDDLQRIHRLGTE